MWRRTVSSAIGLLGCAALVAGVLVVLHFWVRPAPVRTGPPLSPRPQPTQACANAPAVSLPEDFAPVRAERCVDRDVLVPGDGEWEVRQAQRVDGGLAALVAALRQPSQRPGRLPCAAVAVAVPELSLVDGRGRRLRPAVPTNACHGPLTAVGQAVAALPWQTVASTPLHRIRTQLEVDSGCPGAYKPVIPLDAATGRPAAGPADLGDPPALGVCRYRLDPSSVLGGHQGGVLVDADRLTGTALSAVLHAIRAARPVTGPCDRPQQPFAVLLPAGGTGPVAAVELGGCDRVDLGGHLYQLDTTTVSVLSG